jgi:glucose/arabinose dehydrogenase
MPGAEGCHSMRLRKKIALAAVVVLLLGSVGGYHWFSTRESREPSLVAWNTHCASCHGTELRGTRAGPALVAPDLKHGADVAQVMGTIAKGVPGTSMPGWEGKLPPQMIKALALFIDERRQAWPSTRQSFEKVPDSPRLVKSRHHSFWLERIAELASRPYALEALPNGDLIVTEKARGLSLVRAGGGQGGPIPGAPKVWPTLASIENTWINLGSMLDVERHPDYAKNGWLYLSYTDRCQLSCGWPVPATMVRVVRGRIRDGRWVDQEVIWSVHKNHYTPVPDAVAGGRLAFDNSGHLFISIGGKNTYDKLHDLNTPFGKIHRVRDDGTVPEDNPFWAPPSKRPEGSTIHTVWSYGHRTVQGLAAHPVTGEIWNTEMGPRGGDEINLIQRGKNYGWPLYTNGLDYNGEEVAIGKELGLDFPIEDTVLPVVDFTPAPAVSNFTFHKGSRFTGWGNDLLVGSLKASTLYRLRIVDGKLIEQEKLITNFGRIRDVEMGPDGLVYLVIEHGQAGSVWRLRPQ